jgi:hypothetical protein
MSEPRTLADLITENPGVVAPGMTVGEAKRALLDISTDVHTTSPTQALALVGEGKRVWADGHPVNHVPVTTVEEAAHLANAMARYGNYPAGLDACFTAGINGDAADGCPFAGTPDCTCDEP